MTSRVSPRPRGRRQPNNAFGRRLLDASAIVLAVFLVSPPLAHAYIDPGSGALLWQAILAAFFGLMFYLRGFVRSLKDKLGIRRPHRATNARDDQRPDWTHGASP